MSSKPYLITITDTNGKKTIIQVGDIFSITGNKVEYRTAIKYSNTISITNHEYTLIVDALYNLSLLIN